jgi:glycosyltransferase involved in cell wall biosynthesis
LERISRQVTSGQIVFTGFYQREKLAVLYALAEAFVFPTHSDPWGLVVNEAMACGLPIITTSAAGCAADLVDDGCNGRIVAPKETYRLAAAMAQLAVDPILRADMGAKSRRRISDYSPAKCAAGMATAAEMTRNQYVA